MAEVLTEQYDEACLDDIEASLAAGSPYSERRYGGSALARRFTSYETGIETRARSAGVLCERVNVRHVYRKYGGCCGICKQPVTLEEFTIDHIIPVSRGGGHVFDNLQPAHLLCNVRKGAR